MSIASATLLSAIVATACAGTPTATAPPSPSVGPSPSVAPTSTVTPSPSGSGEVTSAAQAVALVLASDPMFAAVGPLSPELIGACCWYEVAPSTTSPGWMVTVTVGWGDCQAGCIDRHTWTYEVPTAGDPALVSESGPEPPSDVVPGQGTGPATLNVHLVAGPTCPVETVPPDPACAPRPVGNAQLVVRDQHGRELSRATSDASGLVSIELPPGVYIVEAQPAEGLMGTPEAVAVAIAPGGGAELSLGYDTGIR